MSAWDSWYEAGCVEQTARAQGPSVPTANGGPVGVNTADSYASCACASDPGNWWTSLMVADNIWAEENSASVLPLDLRHRGYVAS